MKNTATENLILKNACQLSREDEAELVRAYQAGDSEAGGKLIESQVAWIVSLIRKQRLPASVDMDDLLSELCMIILKALRTYDPSRSTMTTFVATIVQRRIRRITRRLAGYVKTVDSPESLNSTPQTDQRDPLLDELAEALYLTEISPVARTAVELRMLGLKDDAILARLVASFPVTRKVNVSRLIEDALEAIRDKMRDLGHDIDDHGTSLQGELF